MPVSPSTSLNAGASRIVHFAVIVSLGLVAGWSWWVQTAESRVQGSVVRALRLTDLRADILHLDELLTNSARLCAATGDLTWEKRYLEHVDTLDHAIKEATALIPPASASQFTSQTDMANQKLVALAMRSFDLVREKRNREALDLLRSEPYMTQKNVYAAGLSTLLEAMQEQVAASQRDETTIRRLILLQTFAAGGMLVLVWVWLSLLVRRHKAERREAEKALQASENQMRAFMDYTPAVVFLKDLEGRYLFVNPRYEQLFHVRREQLLGKTDYDLFPKDVADALRANDRAVLASGIAQEVEEAVPQDDGPHVYTSLKFPARDGAGEVYAICGVATDITERKKAEQERQKLIALVENSSDFIGVAELDGKASFINPAGRRLVGLEDSASFSSMTIWDFLHSSACEQVRQLVLPRVHECGVWHGESKFRHLKTETPIPVEISAFQVRHPRTGQPFCLATVARDISDRKRAEAMLRQSNEELESRVLERTRLSTLYGELGLALATEDNLDAILQRCAEILVPSVDAAFARIWTLNEAEQALELRASAGMYTHRNGPHGRVPIGQFKIGQIAQERKPHLTNQVIGDPRVGDQEWARREGMVAFAGHPLLVGSRLEGVLAVFARHPLSDAALAALKTAADAVAAGIERVQAREELLRARAMAEANERRTRLIVESSHDAYVAIDEESAIVDWNRQAQETFGWTREEAVGRPLHEMLIPPAQREAHLRGLKQLLATGHGPVLNRRIELSALHRDGHEFPVEATISPIRLESGWVFSAFLHDISDRKAWEKELERAKELAEAANRAKSEFLANMSHEIRTPMNGILGMTGLTLDTQLTSEQRQYLEAVRESGEALLRLLNDILDFSKIEAGKLEFDEADFSLDEAISGAVKALAVRAHEKGLEMTYHVDPDVPDGLVGDPGRLRQIVVNLAGNAIKFTEHGEVAVHVQVEDLSEVQAVLHVAVRDTGIGIPLDKQRQIFDPFTQADSSTTRKYGGTGLGLTISAQLVKRMKGRIWLESEPGLGSTFHFTASLPRSKKLPAQDIPTPPIKLQNMPALIVDDNPTNQRILEELLNRWRMRPTVTNNASTALMALGKASAEGEPFSLLLVDSMMPGMNGFTFLERVRRLKLPNVTAIVLTSSPRPGDAARRRELGVAAYLIKPVRPTELLDAIVKSLRISWHDRRQTAPAARVAASPDGPCLRVLLAEDNLINQQVAGHMLKDLGHVVSYAASGQEALQALDRESFDLVLMDVQMPEMDGFEATAAIRAREKETGQRLPIIALTAHAMKGDRERCMAAGMDGYLSKPIQPKELRKAIGALLFQAPDAPPLPPGQEDEAAKTAAASSPAWTTDETILDREAVLGRVGGDRKRLRKLIGLLAGECPKLFATLQEAVERKDAVAVERAAHALKGEVANLGAVTAARTAKRLEDQGRAGDLSDSSGALAALHEDLGRFQAGLAQLGQEEQP